MLCYSTTTWSSLYLATIKAVSQHKSRQQSHSSSPTVPFPFCMKYSTYPVRASVDIERVRATEGQTKRARKKIIIIFHIFFLDRGRQAERSTKGEGKSVHVRVHAAGKRGGEDERGNGRRVNKRTRVLEEGLHPVSTLWIRDEGLEKKKETWD